MKFLSCILSCIFCHAFVSCPLFLPKITFNTIDASLIIMKDLLLTLVQHVIHFMNDPFLTLVSKYFFWFPLRRFLLWSTLTITSLNQIIIKIKYFFLYLIIFWYFVMMKSWANIKLKCDEDTISHEWDKHHSQSETTWILFTLKVTFLLLIAFYLLLYARNCK